MKLVVYEVNTRKAYEVRSDGGAVIYYQITDDEADLFKRHRNLDARIVDNQLLVRNTVDRVVKIKKEIVAENLDEKIGEFLRIFQEAELEITDDNQLVTDIIKIFLVVW